MLRLLAAATFTAMLALPALGIEICGSGKRVDCIVDGDTLWWRGEKIRILAMDTPEISEPRCQAELSLGLQARQALLDLVNAGDVRLDRRGMDRYGRTLASVSAGGKDAATALIELGLARIYVDHRESWCE